MPDDQVTNKSAFPGAKFTDKAWDGSAARFTAEQYVRACAWVADKAAGELSKADAKLPHHEPDGTVSLAGLRAALGAGVQIELPPPRIARRHALAEHLVSPCRKGSAVRPQPADHLGGQPQEAPERPVPEILLQPVQPAHQLEALVGGGLVESRDDGVGGILLFQLVQLLARFCEGRDRRGVTEAQPDSRVAKGVDQLA